MIWLQLKTCYQCLKGGVLSPGSCENLAKFPARTAFSRSRSQTALSGSPVPLLSWKSGGGARGHAKLKESLQTLQTNLKTGLGRAALDCPPEGVSALYSRLREFAG